MTPPEIRAALELEFGGPWVDPCPHPRPESFDGLRDPWPGDGWAYVNPPFSGTPWMKWIRRSLFESYRRPAVVIALPVYQARGISFLLLNGAEVRRPALWRWLAIEDGSAAPLRPDSVPVVLAVLKKPILEMQTNESGAL